MFSLKMYLQSLTTRLLKEEQSEDDNRHARVKRGKTESSAPHKELNALKEC